MEFYSPNGLERPVRLSEKTRAFAYDSLHYRYGLDTRRTPSVSLDDVEGFDKLSQIEKHDLAIERIAREAPLRICEGERISGAATLGDAINHVIPATYAGNAIIPSISHLTIDFETVMIKGITGIRMDAEDALEKYRGTEREPFARSCVSCLDSFETWHSRYLEALGGRPGYEDNLRNLRRVPMYPAETFYEAVQSIWFTFAFVRLCGNRPGIGRLDLLLCGYLFLKVSAFILELVHQSLLLLLLLTCLLLIFLLNLTQFLFFLSDQFHLSFAVLKSIHFLGDFIGHFLK